MNPFPVSGPRTIFDWIALRDEFRGKVEVLDMEALSMLYGLSNTVGYHDPIFVNEVEAFLSKSIDPIRTHFNFAYQLTSEFWDAYELWDFSNVQFDKGKNASGFVDDFNDKVLIWLVDGLTSYSNETNVMDSAFFVVSRIGNYDTFLEEADIPLLEAAAKKEISLKTSPGGRELIEIFRKYFAEQQGDNSGANRSQSEDDDASGKVL